MEKIGFEPQDILERLYRPKQIYDGILTEDEFNKIPLNEDYIRNQKKRENEKIKLNKIESNIIKNDIITEK
jgi:hypothetical protein